MSYGPWPCNTNRTLILLCIFFFFAVAISLGQNQPVSLLKGIVTNITTGEAVPYATIGLSKSSINTMTNEKGEFIFKIPADRVNDSIDISHVGYKPIRIIVNSSDTGFRIIKMQEAVSQLSAVIKKTINPLDLI